LVLEADAPELVPHSTKRFIGSSEIWQINHTAMDGLLVASLKLNRDVIRSLSEARHNRKLFSERLEEGRKKLNLQFTRQVRRIFDGWINLGAASFTKGRRSDVGKPRRSEYWYNLSCKIYEDGNKGDSVMTRTQVASRVEDQIYEYTKLELSDEVAKLEAAGFSGEKLDLEVSRLIKERQEICNEQRCEIQKEISALKTKISEFRKRKLNTKAVYERIKDLKEQKQAIVVLL
jgi:putative transposase